MQSAYNERYFTSTPVKLHHHAQQHAYTAYTYGQLRSVLLNPDIQYSQANDPSYFNIPSELLQKSHKHLTSTVIECGQNFVDNEIKRYINASRIYSYFSVDTSYVLNKLILLLFPFIHKDWCVGLQMKPNAQEPILPKHNLNAPDLYIPLMAFITYGLVGGFSLGLQGHFTPEALCLLTSTSLFWVIVEVVSLSMALFLLNINNVGLATFDILAFCSYKYFSMSLTIVFTFLYPSAYYMVLLYFSFAIFDFMICSLKIRLLQDRGSYAHENEHTFYLLPIVAAAVQPMMIWWLTRRLAMP